MFRHKRRSLLPEWAIPLSYAVLSLVAGLSLPRFEHRFLAGFTASISPAVALTILSAITTGMIALTGVVFSLAFVMVQFSAVAYSPRLVLWVSRDPVIWHALGIFTATFLYGIGEMAWIDRNGSGRVPLFSTWFVVLLMLASVALFVALIERIAMLQIGQMLAFTVNLGSRVIEKIYPPLESPARIALPDELAKFPVTQTVLYSGGPQALQAIDTSDLLALATQSGGTVELATTVGDTLINGMSLLRVFGGSHRIPDERWRRTFTTGLDRTFDQDPKYALRLLVDIAIKALSPAINDPTTAVQALDHIHDYLLRLGSRRLEVGALRDRQGMLKAVVPYPSWEDFLRLAFDEIRYCGSTSIQVMRRMRALVGDLIAALPPERHAALEHHLRRLGNTVARSFANEEEKLEASVADRQGLGAPAEGEVSARRDTPKE